MTDRIIMLGFLTILTALISVMLFKPDYGLALVLTAIIALFLSVDMDNYESRKEAR